MILCDDTSNDFWKDAVRAVKWLFRAVYLHYRGKTFFCDANWEEN